MRQNKAKRLIPFGLFLIFFALGSEAVFRLGIALHLPLFRDPDLYADWTADDDYWKLRQLWGKRVVIESKDLLDPFIGWTPQRTSENPLGAITDKPYKPEFDKPSVLFVGDAFVEGSGAMETRMPQKLGSLLPNVPVYNLGMGGYGLDQIYLRLQQVSFPFKQPVAIVGLVTVDLDRSLLGFRTGPKPYFTLVNGALTLRGVPIPADPKKWLTEYPPKIGSYSLAWFERRLRLWHGGNPLEVVYMREPKMMISEKILGQMAYDARTKKMPLYFVIFYNQQELKYTGWREQFLKQSLSNLNISYIDTKWVLLTAAKSERIPPGSYYLTDGHLNERGNSVVANYISYMLKKDVLTRQLLN